MKNEKDYGKNIMMMLGDADTGEDMLKIPISWLDDPKWLSEDVGMSDAYADLALTWQRHKDSYEGESRIEKEFILVNAEDLAKRWRWTRGEVIELIVLLKETHIVDATFLWDDDYAIHMNPSLFFQPFLDTDRSERNG